MNRTIGFIGCGKMASAMISGILAKKLVPPEALSASARTEATCKSAAEQFGIRTTTDNRKVAERSDILFLAVKPACMADVISGIRDLISGERIVVTMAPGISLADLEKMFGRKVKLVRTMPNTPAAVGAGMTALCPNAEISGEDLALVREILDSFGRSEVVPEHLLGAVTGISGSAPAYVYIFIEAMADAAVRGGMPRAQAYTFAAQAVAGSAEMVLATGRHPAELKDDVCSPGGTTIEAVRVLEEKGFRAAVIDAVAACIEKAGN